MRLGGGPVRRNRGRAGVKFGRCRGPGLCSPPCCLPPARAAGETRAGRAARRGAGATGGTGGDAAGTGGGGRGWRRRRDGNRGHRRQRRHGRRRQARAPAAAAAAAAGAAGRRRGGAAARRRTGGRRGRRRRAVAAAAAGAAVRRRRGRRRRSVAEPAAAPAAPRGTAGGGNGTGGIAVPAGYRLVWSDEFDVDGRPTRPTGDTSRASSRNEEAQWYQQDNARVEGGVLIIEARREQKANPNYQAGQQRLEAQPPVRRIHVVQPPHQRPPQLAVRPLRDARPHRDARRPVARVVDAGRQRRMAVERRGRHHGVLQRPHPRQRRVRHVARATRRSGIR